MRFEFSGGSGFIDEAPTRHARPRFCNRRSGDHDRDRVATVILLNFGNCARGWLLTKSILHFRPGVASLGPISVTHAPAPLATHGRRSPVRAGTWPRPRHRRAG